MPSSVVIIPSIGRVHLARAVASVLGQTTAARCLVVCDGDAYRDGVAAQLQGSAASVCYLPGNTGAGRWYGHRILAAFPHLVDEDFVFFLDDDNWYAPDHVQRCLALAESAALDWVHSLRNIHDAAGAFVCRDDCESLGAWPGVTGTQMIDTSAYCIRRTVAIRMCHAWHGPWGQDRIVTQLLLRTWPRHGCTRAYTLQYRLGGNPRSPDAAFFVDGNARVRARYGAGPLPWAGAG